jgi:hypothetical protein
MSVLFLTNFILDMLASVSPINLTSSKTKILLEELRGVILTDNPGRSPHTAPNDVAKVSVLTD